MRIGIIGAGVVGNATAEALRPHVDEVRCYDSDPKRSTHQLYEAVFSDLCFVCLPTPQKESSLECDVSTLTKMFYEFSTYHSDWTNANFVLRSTVPVGFTRRMRNEFKLINLVHSPEFLTARTAVEDARNPTRLLIGDPTFKVLRDREPQFVGYEVGGCANMLMRLYEKVHGRLPGTPIYMMSSDESEFVKLMQNAFSAVKVSLFNEFRAYADEVELDWERCLSALLAGGWINPMHTQVPGPDGKRGFGGACLPKDLANLIDCLDRADVFNIVMSAALDRNRRDRG